MFEIRVKEEFEAAHRVAGYPGKCDRLHGHSWIVEAVVRGTGLDSLGMLVDFKAVKGTLKEILDGLDHRYLNEIEPFASGQNPTAEHLAKYIYEKTAASALFTEQKRAHLASVTVWESPRSCATYFPEG